MLDRGLTDRAGRKAESRETLRASVVGDGWEGPNRVGPLINGGLRGRWSDINFDARSACGLRW